MSPGPAGDQVDPRVARTREVVLAAAIEALTEDGFERLSIDSVAERSGVARSTIYRNWPDRATLLAEAFRQMPAATVDDLTPTGSLPGDLRILADRLVRKLTSEEWLCTVPTLVGSAAHDDAMQSALAGFCDERQCEAKRFMGQSLSQAGVPEGELTDQVMERFVAPFFFRRLMSQLPLSDQFIDRQIDAAIIELSALADRSA